MKTMLKYNRALDYMVEAMNEMVDGKKRPQVAASLMVKAFAEPDALAAIKTIEATNKLAYAQEKAALEASQRLQATEEMTDAESEFPVETGGEGGAEEFDFDADPLDYVGDDEEEVEAPAVASTTTASTTPAQAAKAPAQAAKPVKAAKAPTKTVAAEMAETLATMVKKRDGK
jgi:hypothetical protein